jgi:hypothetical protein
MDHLQKDLLNWADYTLVQQGGLARYPRQSDNLRIMKATRITATELARNLSDVLNRVRYKGERFEVVRGHDVVAELAPPPKTMTWARFVEFWENVPKPDPEYWDDVEEGIRLMNTPPETPHWES